MFIPKCQHGVLEIPIAASQFNKKYQICIDAVYFYKDKILYGNLKKMYYKNLLVR